MRAPDSLLQTRRVMRVVLVPIGRRLLHTGVTVPLAAAVLTGHALLARDAVAQTRGDRTRLIEQMLAAEDRRGRGPDGIAPLLAGLRHADTAIRSRALDGLGRLERPALAGTLWPLLADSALAGRAANAIAQSLGGLAPAGAAVRRPEDRRLVDSVLAGLAGHARRFGDHAGAFARSIARLPYDEPRQARAAESALLEIAAMPPGTSDSARLEGVAWGLYTIARARRALGDPSAESVAWLRAVAAGGQQSEPGRGVTRNATTPARRLAWLALAAAGHRDAPEVRSVMRDPDRQVRRLGLLYLPNVTDTVLRREVLSAARSDSSFMVRYEWVRMYRQFFASGDCAPLLAATRDANAHVRLAAIDALGAPCPDGGGVRSRLLQIIDGGAAGDAPRRPGEESWHGRAHALVALARTDGASAQPLLRRDASHHVWQVRMYVARAAAAVRDTATLVRLAFDSTGTVREAAIDGLAAVSGHAADLLFVRALASPDYHVVLAAARALRGAPVRDSVLPALIAALDRLTLEKRETSRDPRLELLARIGELDDGRIAPRLVPYLRDFDPAVASLTAEILNRRGGGHVAAPEMLAPSRDPLIADTSWRIRITMAPGSGGGTFVIRLGPGFRAPATSARIVRLVREGYYNGLTWHRVVPNFVLQGGSPAMNEYVGDGPFMRDELGLIPHRRGTLGISTRGRDTGDAQWFINLVDNYRLDHAYTVFAEVESGMDVVDGILEGDVMQRVEVIPARRE